jgi:soluble lytic murein transglycosylase
MKINKKSTLFVIPTIILIIVGIVGATLLTPKLVSLLEELLIPPLTKKPEYRLDAPSEVLALANKTPQERKTLLETIAQGSEMSLDRSRARFLLASDILREDFNGSKALEYLQNLEQEYPILEPYILLRRGRAYELNNNLDQAKTVWQDLITKFPDSLAAAEAYYKLGTYDRQYWQDAINKYPQHPRTQAIARELLVENPEDKTLLLLLAKYDLSPQTKPILDQLVAKYAKELKPEDWDAVGHNYWQNSNYAQSATAYEKGTATAEHLYRVARSYHVSKQSEKAQAGYLKLIDKFPDSPQAGLALRRLASISEEKEALTYLDRVNQKYPLDAPKALIEKITLLTKLERYDEVNQAQNVLLQQYSSSDEAANYRWSMASKLATTGNYISAWQWAQQISVNNPDSSVAPKAAFWVGKWAEKLGQVKEAQTAYQYVLNNHPHSYYAWRAAVRLGKDVGDFTTIRNLDLKVETPINRSIPPAGSNMFKELFLLGENSDAIDLFNAEMGNKQETTVSEQFTQGLLKQTQGKYLDSINLIWSLSKRDNPEDFREWQILRKSPEYWYALFPFPYQDLVVKWSKERKLNPFLVISLIRQESRFEKEIKSPVGATGLMQVMPDTAKWITEKTKQKEYSLTNPEDNINLGTWYLNYTHDTYDNNSMLAIASYNAGPGNVSEWLENNNLDDIDEFIENIPFAETKNYIETVFGNYWNYVELYDPQIKEKIK